jgi:hypothetical protein
MVVYSDWCSRAVRFGSRALGRSGARVSARTLAHRPLSGRPSVLVPTPRPRSVQATASKGVVVGIPSRATAEAGCLKRSRCDSLVRSPPRLTSSFSSAGRTRGRPTGTAGWGRPGSTSGGTARTAAKPSRYVQPRGDRYGCVRETKGAPPTAAGQQSMEFDSPRGLGPKVGAFRPAGGTQTRVTARVIP